MEDALKLEAKLAAFELFLLCVIPHLPEKQKVLTALEAVQSNHSVSRRAAVCAHLNRLHQALRDADTPRPGTAARH